MNISESHGFGPCFSVDTCGSQATADTWIVCLGQLVVAPFVCAIPYVIRIIQRLYYTPSAPVAPQPQPRPSLQSLFRSNSVIFRKLTESLAKTIDLQKGHLKGYQTFVHASNHEVTFASHVREQENFLRGNADPLIRRPPKPLTNVRYRMSYDPWTLYQYFFFETHPFLITTCLSISFLSGAMSTFITLLHSHGKHLESTYGDRSLLEYCGKVSENSSSLISSYRFFPVFVLFGSVAYAISLWRRFVEQTTFIQGRLHDTAIMTGAKVLHPEDAETRRFLFRLYRYLNTAHLLCYRNLKPQLGITCSNDNLVRLGLLTRGELDVLVPSCNKMRDTLCGWAALEIEQAVYKGMLQSSGGAVANLSHAIARFRGYMGEMHDYFDFNQPNVWVANMRLVTDINMIFIIFGMPWDMWMPEQEGLILNFPWATISAVFLIMMAFVSATMMLEITNDPFGGNHDSINTDSLISSSEMTTFALLRVRLDVPLVPKNGNWASPIIKKHPRSVLVDKESIIEVEELDSEGSYESE